MQAHLSDLLFDRKKERDMHFLKSGFTLVKESGQIYLCLTQFQKRRCAISLFRWHLFDLLTYFIKNKETLYHAIINK